MLCQWIWICMAIRNRRSPTRARIRVMTRGLNPPPEFDEDDLGGPAPPPPALGPPAPPAQVSFNHPKGHILYTSIRTNTHQYIQYKPKKDGVAAQNSEACRFGAGRGDPCTWITRYIPKSQSYTRSLIVVVSIFYVYTLRYISGLYLVYTLNKLD